MHLIHVRSDVLRDRGLLASAKLVWMGICLMGESWQRTSHTKMGARLGLSRQTIARALAVLEREAWIQTEKVVSVRRAADRHASVPAALIQDVRLSATDKVLYAQLQLTPDYRSMSGQFTYVELREAFGIDPRTARVAVARLIAAGWMHAAQRTNRRPVVFHLRNPGAERVAVELDAVNRRLRRSSFKGEALMRELLSLLVESSVFQDDASPEFLVDPATGEHLQLDRFYPPGVGFEFNGPQHYAPTPWFPDKEAFVRQQVRDLIKIGLCARNKVVLITVHPEDLSIDTLSRKIGDLLPRRQLAGLGPVVRYIEAKAKRYRATATGELPEQPGPGGKP